MVKDNSKKNKKSPVKLYAIITEGEITEPEYFKALLRYKGGNIKMIDLVVSRNRTVNISKVGHTTVSVGQGKAPNVNNIIIDVNTMLNNPRTPYEKIYCVFDRDNHSGYSKLKTICAQNSRLFDASSVPSFEYWLCLHFAYHSQNLNSQQMTNYLKSTYLLNYNKHIDFNDFQNKIKIAMNNADKSIMRFNQTGIDNPLSYVGEALKDLENEGLINLY